MALTPDNNTGLLDDYVSETSATANETLPSKTYALDFENGTISGFIDGTEALKQYIYKALMTARSRFLIYSDSYGSEVEELIGDSNITPALFDSEIQRIIYEALAYDDRIDDVKNISAKRDGDTVTISFTVVPTSDKEFTMEVTI